MTKEFLQGKSENTFLAGVTMSKKDKGEGIQKSDDCKIITHPCTLEDIQVSIYNKFNSLSNYPPLPYKSVVMGLPLNYMIFISPNILNIYFLRVTKLLLLKAFDLLYKRVLATPTT